MIYHAAEDEIVRKFNLPHANLAVLMLGQGTSITQDAVAMLAAEKVHVAFCGSGGTPLHMGALTEYGGTDHFRRMVAVWMSPSASLAAGRSLMEDRIALMREQGLKAYLGPCGGRDRTALLRACAEFEAALPGAGDADAVMGAEGLYARRLYAAFAKTARIEDFVRTPGQPGAGAAGLANGFIDHGNYLAYGLAGAILWMLGIPYHMSILHGKTRAGGLVFDLADAFKDSLVLPQAFQAARRGLSEKEFREGLLRSFEDNDILKRGVASMEKAIKAGEDSLA